MLVPFLFTSKQPSFEVIQLSMDATSTTTLKEFLAAVEAKLGKRVELSLEATGARLDRVRDSLGTLEQLGLT